MNEDEYDLVVIGSGPAGQKGAIAAAKAHKRVAMIDRTVMIGGVSVHTGTIPSKTIREAIFQLTGSAVKALYGNEHRNQNDISVQDRFCAIRIAETSRSFPRAQSAQCLKATQKAEIEAVYDWNSFTSKDIGCRWVLSSSWPTHVRNVAGSEPATEGRNGRL